MMRDESGLPSSWRSALTTGCCRDVWEQIPRQLELRARSR